MTRRPHPLALLVLIAAALGFVFAAISTYDFVEHLDRQVHSIHCSFVPGLGGTTATSGCKTAMLSPYSSVFRSQLWGGIPISLPAMALFAFLAFLAAELILGRRQSCRRSTGLLMLVALVPAAASVVMGLVSATQLGTFCKLCIGIYTASGLCLAGAVGLFLRARKEARDPAPEPQLPRARVEKEEVGSEPAWVSGSPDPDEEPPEEPPEESPEPRPQPARHARPPETPLGQLLFAVVLGLVFVAVPVAAYAALAPDHAPYVGACGRLEVSEDTYGVSVPLDDGGEVPALELLDPLCPACRAFEARLGSVESAGKLARRAVLFPLDDSCNWMVDEAVHPGACGVSEAVLCAGDRSAEVVHWAFEHQEEIRERSKSNPDASRAMARQKFPELSSCIGSPKVQSRINKSLRWIVKNHLPVLTPQLFVDGTKLCDEDVDLGLEFALDRLLEARDNGGAK